MTTLSPITAATPARRARRGSARGPPRRARPRPAPRRPTPRPRRAMRAPRRAASEVVRLHARAPRCGSAAAAPRVLRPSAERSRPTRARVCPDRAESTTVRPQPWPLPTATSARLVPRSTAATPRGALKSLDRARKGYARALDSEGLEHVLDMAALVDASDDRIRIGRENLAYAAKQNLRQESRRRARQLGRDWTDPFPDLQAPTEHTGLVLTRGVKLWIGVGVLAGIAAIVGLVLVNVLIDTGPKTTVTLRLRQQHRTDGHRSGVRRRDLPEPRGRAGRGDGDGGRCEQAGPGLQARPARPGRMPAAARP